ncbi:MAG: hypothetical protein IPO55_07875 [Alphaproteobacteria bacterium]|nr:hypothetical protein [Alphaproteobacteria bacterium]
MSDDQKQKLAEYVMRPQTKAAAVLSAYAYFGNTLDFPGTFSGDRKAG